MQVILARKFRIFQDDIYIWGNDLTQVITKSLNASFSPVQHFPICVHTNVKRETLFPQAFGLIIRPFLKDYDIAFS